MRFPSLASWFAFATVATLGALSTGCTYSVHEYQAGGYAASPQSGPPRMAEWIHARGQQSVVLGITNNTKYVDAAYASLLDQCSGEIVGLNTRFSTSLSFLSYTNVVEMRAMCLRDPASIHPPPRPPDDSDDDESTQ
jgi:hypothetical protein